LRNIKKWQDWLAILKGLSVGVDCNVSLTLLSREKKGQENYIGEVSHCLKVEIEGDQCDI
jgi:hypothetical protein